MRRREKESRPGSRPARLRAYDGKDWVGVGCHPECAFWEAVDAWHDEHPESGDEPLVLTDGPDVPWHDEWV